MINIERRLPALHQYLAENPDIVAAYLYGSYGTAVQTVLSDVDLGILLRRGLQHDFRRYLNIQSAVIDIAGEEDVNVVILNSVPVVLQHEILATGRLLYERSRNAEEHWDFIEQVIKRYPDFAFDFQAFCREYDRSLREAYLHGKQK
jgi:predicted nucleotidyltransferase